jgi:arginine decarboxylase
MAVPLHENGTFSEASQLLRGAYQLDYSTSFPELGSLFVSTGDKPLQRLKRQIADWYGMGWSFPSTHGTTGLNILALLSACPPGGRVLVNRDAHSSVTAAMIHGGFTPVYFTPRYDTALRLTLGPTAAAIEGILETDAVDCVFLTSPNYFGIVGEVEAIIRAAHARGLPVVVDAAHAPHFHFCRALPIAAEDAGADFVAQSTHKVASALSQGSVLLVRDESRLEPLYAHINELGFVSTSFSYPILASIELALRQLAEEGGVRWTRTIERAQAFRSAVRGLPGIDCFGDEQKSATGFCQLDPTRLTLDVSALGLTGFDVERRLQKAGIYPEMATIQLVLFLITPGTSDEDLRVLYEALETITGECRRAAPLSLPAPPPTPEMALIPRAAKFASKRRIPVNDAIGAISGETIATYPPGIPIVAAGEVLTADVIEYLRRLHAHGAVLKGASDQQFETIRVVERARPRA